MGFSENLKNARNQKKYTKAKMAELLNIPYTSYNNFENGREPKVEMMLKIARVLDLSLYDLIGQESMSTISANEWRESWTSSSVLSNAEQEHIKKYRSLSNTDKETVDILVDRLSIREKDTQYLNFEPPKVIDLYPHLASAGTGQYLFDDIPIAKIEVPFECEADFAIGVNGDSMSPTFSDGDDLLIKKQSSINEGEIGIFIIDGESYVKEYQKDKLISHNPKYPDIEFKENMSIQCVGKVIGIY